MPLNIVLGNLKITIVVLVLNEFKEDDTFTFYTLQDTQEVTACQIHWSNTATIR